MENKIYVICPAHHQTGGTELAHQLVDYFNNKNKLCYIVYYAEDNFIEAPIPDGFKKYNIKSTTLIEDNVENYLFIPETALLFAKKTKSINLFFWWMSFDNFFGSSSLYDYFKYFFKGFFSLKNAFTKLYFFNIKFTISLRSIRKNYNNRLIHLYQSKYASAEINRLGFHKQLPLSDYINKNFIEDYLKNIKSDSFSKKDIVLYNPAKGFDVTKKLIKSMPDVKFIALKGLSREEMKELFNTAKVYIDFGNHPGKDRIPREACINGCCIIVGKKGSAKYFEDIPIKNEYKFFKSQMEEIKNTIYNIFNNFEEHDKDFVYYRSRIVKEEEIFYNEIENIIDVLEAQKINLGNK